MLADARRGESDNGDDDRDDGDGATSLPLLLPKRKALPLQPKCSET
jgi:hypothetical protein